MFSALNEYGYHAATPLRLAARAARDFWRAPSNPASNTTFGRTLYAAADLFSNLTRRYGKPEWRVDEVTIAGSPVRVREIEVWASPWCRLIHFARDQSDMRKAGRRGIEPVVLLVAPLSGHYAT